MEHGGLQTLQSYCHFVTENMDEELFKQAREYIRVNFSSHIDFLVSDIWFGRGKIGIDGGCAYGMQLNCLICDEGIYTTASIKNLWNRD